jgi:hypothetical protein
MTYYNSVNRWVSDRFSSWDDLRFPFTAHKLGANAKPDFDETNVGLLFAQNDTTEIIFLIGQMPHSWKEGSIIYPHIHWQQMNGNNVVWKMAYKWFNRGTAVPADFTDLTGDSATNSVITYVSGNMSQVTRFGEGIDGTDKIISSILLLKVWRDDDVDAGAGTGDALAFEFDIHYEMDASGSDLEIVKNS